MLLWLGWSTQRVSLHPSVCLGPLGTRREGGGGDIGRFSKNLCVCVCVCVCVCTHALFIVPVFRFTRWGTEPCRLCAGHTGAIAAVSACSGVDTLVATAARDSTLRLWDTNEWAQVGGGVVLLCCSHPWGFGGSQHWSASVNGA
jgi:hypothetical protein